MIKDYQGVLKTYSGSLVVRGRININSSINERVERLLTLTQCKHDFIKKQIKTVWCVKLSDEEENINQSTKPKEFFQVVANDENERIYSDELIKYIKDNFSDINNILPYHTKKMNINEYYKKKVTQNEEISTTTFVLTMEIHYDQK